MSDKPRSTRICPWCTHANPGTARFCNDCGGAFAEARPVARAVTPLARAELGERRQLTVLFCDLVGSTKLGAQLELDDYYALMRTYHELGDNLIGLHGGSVGQHQGDGILSYFGWPTSHGDDAERAIRAGLALVDEMQGIVVGDGTRLEVRIGIHTGLVVVSDVEGGLNVETLALGDAANVAARVQAECRPSEVLVTGATHRLVSGLFHVEDRGTQALRGAAGPIQLFRVVRSSGALNRLAAAAAKGLTPFVGRESELDLLRERWDLARDGRGQIVLVSGEAGLGKSRLVEQLKVDLSAVPHTRIECSGSPYHQNSAFYPIAQMLRNGLGWPSDYSPEQKVQSLEQAIVQVGLQPHRAVPLVAPLLDLPVAERYPPLNLSPEEQRGELISTLVEWVCSTARLQRTVMVVEDLHWADPSTLELLTTLTERVAEIPLLLLFTTRPVFQSPWGSNPHYSAITLNQLTRPEVGTMIAHFATDLDPSSEVYKNLVTRAGGVPLFVEELARVVTETSTESRVPETLQDSLMARLDRLGSPKQVARFASVVGRQFSYRLLRAIWRGTETDLQAALASLEDAELIFAQGAIPDATYLFKHVLIREAAYDSLLKEPRATLHRAVADSLVTEFRSTADTEPEVVAGHYTGAGAFPQAVEWWQTAGERAGQRAAHAEAIKHYHTALELLENLPKGADAEKTELGIRVPLGLSLASARGYSSPEVELNYRTAHQLCRSLGDAAEMFPVVRGLCTFYIVRDRHKDASELAQQCIRIGEETQTLDYRVEGHNAFGYTKFYLGEFHEARQHLERGSTLYQTRRDSLPPTLQPQDPGVACLSLLAPVLWLLGYPEQAEQRLAEALELARRLDSAFSVAYCCTYGATACEMWRDYPRAEKFSQEAVDISSEHGFDVLRCAGTMHLGIAKGMLGEPDEGISLFTEALAEWRATGSEFMRSYFLAGLAEVHRDAGRFDAARANVEEALEHAKIGPNRFFEAELYRLGAELTDDPDEAVGSLERAIALAQEQDAKSLELRAYISLARLLGEHTERGATFDRLREIYGTMTEGLQTKDVRDAAALLAERP